MSPAPPALQSRKILTLAFFFSLLSQYHRGYGVHSDAEQDVFQASVKNTNAKGGNAEGDEEVAHAFVDGCVELLEFVVFFLFFHFFRFFYVSLFVVSL